MPSPTNPYVDMGSAGGPTGGGSNQPPAPPKAPPLSGGSNTPVPIAPGRFGVNVATVDGALAAAEANVASAKGLAEGMASVLFGDTNQQTGEHSGGLPLLGPVAGAVGTLLKPFQEGDDPLSGALRAVGGIPGGIGDTLKNAGDIAGGAAELLPSGPFGFLTGNADLKAQFDAIPDLDPDKQAALAAMSADPMREGHYMYTAAKAWALKDAELHPTLYPELSVAPGSFADTISGLLDIVGATSKGAVRAVSGAGKIGNGGLNRLQELDGVMRGELAYNSGVLGLDIGGHEGANETEMHAWEMWNSGEWSVDEALDYLSNKGAGTGHDAVLNIAASVALDPQVWGSLGAAGLTKLGITGMRLTASAALAAERSALTGTKVAAPVLHGADRSINVLGKLAGNEKVSSVVRALGSSYYGPLESNYLLGTAAKAARIVIDPLHVLGGQSAVGGAMHDINATLGVRMLVETHGFGAVSGVIKAFHDASPTLVDELMDGIGVYVGNMSRKVTLREHIQIALAKAGDKGESLYGQDPNLITDDLLKGSVEAKDFPDLLKTAFIDVQASNIDRANLLDRLAMLNTGLDRPALEKLIEGMSDMQLSFVHAATFGKATQIVDMAKQSALVEIGKEAFKKLKIDKLTLVNRQTLGSTKARQVAEEVRAAIAGTDLSPEEIADIIRDYAKQFPTLARIPLENQNLEASISRWLRHLDRSIAEGVFPQLYTQKEIAKLPQVMQDAFDRLGEGWMVVVRPEDDVLSGLVRDLDTGLLVQGYDPWLDNIADFDPWKGNLSYRLNAIGIPLLGKPLRAGIDLFENTAGTLRANVSSSMVVANAHSRFASIAAERFGLTDAESKKLVAALDEFAQTHKRSVRSLGPSDMSKATKGLLPTRMAGRGTMTQKDMLMLVLEAYEGDLRYVGYTQKFTGLAKRYSAIALSQGSEGGNNFVAGFSEYLYQLIRYTYNAIFQTQERVESIIMNPLRGITPAFGSKMSAEDSKWARIWQNLADTGVIRGAIFEQAEHSLSLAGQTLEESLKRRRGMGFWSQLGDVQGNKRLNMLRTFADDHSKGLRSVMPEGEWDKLKAAWSVDAGRELTDSQVALRYLTEQGLATDVKVAMQGVTPVTSLESFKHAISQPVYQVDPAFGAARPLHMEYMSKSLGIATKDGTDIMDLKSLRKAIDDPQEKDITVEFVRDILEQHGAHPDYIKRVENALNFHYDSVGDRAAFWLRVRETFNVDEDTIKGLQAFYARAAINRGMDPSEFLSQMFNPAIKGGEQGVVDDIKKTLDNLFKPAKKGVKMDENEFILRLTDTFVSHLDESGKQTLMRTFLEENPNIGAPPVAQVLETAASTLDDGRVVTRTTAISGSDRLVTLDIDGTARTFRVSPAAGITDDTTTLNQVFDGLVAKEAGKVEDALTAGLELVLPNGSKRMANKWTEVVEGAADEWTPAHTQELADRMQRYLNGTPASEAAAFRPVAGRGTDEVRGVAAEYSAAHARPSHIPGVLADVDPDFSLRTARAYDAMPTVPNPQRAKPVTNESVAKAASGPSARKLKKTPDGVDQETVDAYQAFLNETMDQYEFLLSKGYKFDFQLTDPYTDGLGKNVQGPQLKKSERMRMDVEQNKHISVFAGSASHPLLTDEQNAIFRGVHDIFGHAQEGLEFGPTGEFNAARIHSAMYGDEARSVMLTETHGQNSFVNFSDKQLPRTDPDVYTLAHPDQYRSYPVSQTRNVTSTKSVGDGMRDLPEVDREPFMSTVVRLRDEMPNVGLAGYDVRSLGKMLGAKYDAHGAVTVDEVVIINSNATRRADYAQAKINHESSIATGTMPYSTYYGPEAMAVHEWGHVVSNYIDRGNNPATKAFRDDYIKGVRSGKYTAPSRYGAGKGLHAQAGSDDDIFAELSVLALMPETVAWHPDVAAKVAELQDAMELDGLWRGRAMAHHRGDLGVGHDTTLERMTEGRGTGHFGTGTYFTSPTGGLTTGVHSTRPLAVADLRNYNLFKPKDASEAANLHSALKDINNAYRVTDPTRQAEMIDGAATELARLLNEDEAIVRADIVNALSRVGSGPNGTDQWSASTQFMVMQGYEGVDVRHIPRFDNTDYGTVVYNYDKGEATVHTPMTVAEVNKQKPGTIYADQKVGKMPQEIRDEFQTRYVGTGPGLESNPDVTRGMQEFAKWTKNVVGDGMPGLKQDPKAAEVLAKMSGVDTTHALPYNMQEQVLMNHIGNFSRQAATDAFRLHYFAQNRSVLQRSVNHPFFGIYPASYMWGKVLPELTKFMLHSPVGLRTGAMAYTANDLAMSVAAQMELDPEFAAFAEQVGESEIAWFLGFMLPAVPTDVGAAAPAWARDLAQQGLDNQERVQNGQPAKDIDFTSPLGKVADYLTPLRQVNQVLPPLGELGDIASAPFQPSEFSGPGDDNAALTSGGLSASQVQPLLASEMEQLQAILSGQ